MSIITSVYGEVAADGDPVANGEPWWQGWKDGVYRGAFCSQRGTGTAGEYEYRIRFAPGTFQDPEASGDVPPPALVVTAGSVSRGVMVVKALRSPQTIVWEIEPTSVGTASVFAWKATIAFDSEGSGDTPFSFVATGVLGEALKTTIKVLWDDASGTLSVDPHDLFCDHPMTLEWVPMRGDVPTNDFYITAILGLPTDVFGIPQGKQRTNGEATPLVWKAFNNCPTSPTNAEYRYTICAAKNNQVACLDPRITNQASPTT